MTRTVLVVALVVGALSTPAVPLAQSAPDAFFIRKEVHLRAEPSTAGAIQTTLRPGLTVRMLETTPQNGFAKVRTTAGQEGWVSVAHIRPIAALDAEQALESLGGLEAADAARRRGPVALAAAAPCKPFNACPVVGY